MNKKEIKNSLRSALFSLDSEKKINGIAGKAFQKRINAQVATIIANIESNKFRRLAKSGGLESYIGTRVRLFGDISSLEMGACYVSIGSKKLGEKNRLVTYCRCRVQLPDQMIECVSVTDEAIISCFQKLKNMRVMITGTAIEVPVSGRRTKAVLFVDHVSESDSLLDAIQPSKSILVKAEKFIEKNKLNLLETIAGRLTKRFKIVGDESKVTAAILPQIALLIAAGSPYLGNKCGMIHVLCIGDPGGGKSFLMKMLELLLVHFQEVHGGRLTVPGFTASTKIDHKSGAVSTKKGYLPLAHRGAIYLQDVHMVKNEVFSEISHIMSDQMEFGKVVIGTSANTTHPAATSDVVDMNFISRVDKTRDYSAHQDLRWETHILSRFDLMLVIEPLKKDKAIIGKITESNLSSQALYSSSEDDMIFKTIIALLHTKIPKVNMDAVMKLVESKLEAFYSDNLKIRDSVEFDSSFNRLPKSLAKIITAHARLNLRAVANEDDVEFAMRLVRLKFNTLKILEPAIKTHTLKASYMGPSETRRRWINTNFSGEPFKVQRVTKKYEREFPDAKVSERTIKRDLEQIAEPLGKGRWQIPIKWDATDVKNVNFDKNDIIKSTTHLKTTGDKR